MDKPVWRAGVEKFLQEHPNSPWAASLHYDYASYCRRSGRTTKALEQYQAAWSLVKNDHSLSGHRLGGAILANWTDLLSSLGRLEQLKELIAIGDGWHFVSPQDRDKFRGAKYAYTLMRQHPEIAYRCGTFALKAVGGVLKPNDQALESLVEVPSPTNGFSMAALLDLAKKYGLNLVAVRRTAGQDLIVPSVVHWRQNHYAAILDKDGDNYLVSDPTFGSEKWLTADAINEEASGEFLIPAGKEETGWKALALDDAEKIHGMGLPNNINDGKDCGCPTPGACCGMPKWWVTEPYINLWIEDQPLSYLTSRGESFPFQITYKQRDTRQYLGAPMYNPGWNNSWCSYVVMDSVVANSPTFAHCDISVFLANGGEVDFPHNFSATQRFDSQTRLTIMQVGSNLSGQDVGNNGLRLIYPDGSQDIYGLVPPYAKDEYAQIYCLLTRHIDPHGNTTWFNYTESSAGGYYLSSVVDYDGRTNTLGYTSNYLISSVTNAYGKSAHFLYDTNANLTNIVDAQGLSSTITYDTNDYPATLITPYGTNSFSVYSIPDDTNTVGGDGNLGGDTAPYIDRAILATDPIGGNYLYLYQFDCSTIMSSSFSSSDVPTNTPLGTLETGAGSTNILTGVWSRNSFYWGPRQYPLLSTTNILDLTANDYLRGRMQHWLEDTNQLYLDGYLSVEQDPSPDGSTPGLMTFYDYQGKQPGYNFCSGTNALPSVIAWRLPGGETHYEYYQYDYFENITNDITTYTTANGSLGTRTNQFIYTTNTYSYAFGEAPNGFGGGISVSITTPYIVPNLLTAVIGPDGNPIWRYGGFDTVTWTNYFNDLSIVQTDATITTSLRVLPDYATNGLGQIATTIYTGSGNPVTNYDSGTPWDLVYPGYDKVASVTSVAGLITTNIYSPDGFLAQTIDEQIGRTNSFTYGTDGLVNTWTNELGLALGLTWDNLMRLTEIQYPDGTYDYIYYDASYAPLDPDFVIDRDENLTSFTYDGDRHLTAIERPNGTTTYDWCACGALAAVIDALNNQTTLNYDNQGNLTNVFYPDNTSLTYQYDLARRITSVSDALGRSLTIGYNNQGLITTVSNANGLLESVVYDIKDRPVQVTDANGVTMTNGYDLIDELLSRTWQDGISEHYGYNAAGLVAYTNRDGQVTQYGLDVAGRLIAATNANKEVVQLAYNPSGEITALTNGLNQPTTWQYNQYGLLTNKTDAIGRDAFRFAYDPNGWLTNRWTPEKGNTAYNYDHVGNILSIVYPNFTDKYAYDARNELTNMVDASGTNLFAYTAVGQLQSETGPWPTDTVAYLYSQQLRTNLTLSEPGGSWTQGYSYDSGWRMTGVSSPAGAFGYAYGFQPASFLVSGITLPNGAGIANSYDSLARLTQTILTNHWGHTLDGYSYTLDPLGLRTNILRNLGLTSSSVSVGYDNIGQLIQWFATETNGLARFNEQLAFGFDAADNLHFRTNDALSQTFTVDGANELTNVSRAGAFTLSGAMPAPATSITVNGQAAQSYGDFTFAATNLSLTNGANTFTIAATNVYGVPTNTVLALNLPQSVSLAYDNNGNLTNDGTRTFGYNTENQLTNVFVPGEWRSDFVYDGLGRRRIVREYTPSGGGWVETNEVHIIYDGYLPIQERDANNNVLVTYTRGLDLSDSLQGAGGIGGLLARTDTNGSKFYHGDGAGNITALMDGQEDIVARYMYGPFGKLLGQWGSMAGVNEMQFSSMPRDAISGLSFYPFRAYEPNFQRWLNQDPIQEQGGINLYRFSFNNPFGWFDPLGLYELYASGMTSDSFGGSQAIILNPGSTYGNQVETGIANYENTGNPNFLNGVPQTPLLPAVVQDVNNQSDVNWLQLLVAGMMAGNDNADPGELPIGPIDREPDEPLPETPALSGDEQPTGPTKPIMCPVRVRHYTSPEDLKKIKQSQKLLASRPADNPGVWFAREPFPASADKPQVGEAGRGAYVEVDAPPGMQPVQNPGESPWGFVPTGGAPLDISNLNPTYVGLGLFGLW
ncbi:MAG TPA: RHS repeat-associated core domain-containing protein [Candidatus Sulfotelmatobacter sp.]|nr:RHS repeat-associated core domain-containing protein [Candidatus Sulfotelmatobacter sp.]